MQNLNELTIEQLQHQLAIQSLIASAGSPDRAMVASIARDRIAERIAELTGMHRDTLSLTRRQALAALSLLATVDRWEALQAIESPLDAVQWGRDIDAASAAFDAAMARYVDAGLAVDDWQSYRDHVGALRAMCEPREPRKGDRCYSTAHGGWDADAFAADHDAWVAAGHEFEMMLEGV